MKEFCFGDGKSISQREVFISSGKPRPAGALSSLFLCQWRCRSYAAAGSPPSPPATDLSPWLRPHIGTDPDPPLRTKERRVYNTWEEARMQVHRYSDNLYRSFSSREEAVQAFNKFVEEHGDPSHNAETSTSCSSTSISKDAQLFYGNNAPWEVDVQGLLFSTGWVDFCEALDIKLEDEIVFRHMGFFKFQFFIFQNGERVAILDAQGDGIERNLHLEMLDLLWINVKSSIPGTFALDILSECKSLLVTSYDLQSEPGQLLSFIYNTEPEDEGVNVFHGDKHVYFHSRDYNYGDSFGHLKFILTENNPWGSQSFFVL
nr:uncharacterized protein LOC109185007 [Ipomoea batatas]GMD17223.1 uncharacterized protein LOC109185007 [Ipomoea batatas]